MNHSAAGVRVILLLILIGLVPACGGGGGGGSSGLTALTAISDASGNASFNLGNGVFSVAIEDSETGLPVGNARVSLVTDGTRALIADPDPFHVPGMQSVPDLSILAQPFILSVTSKVSGNAVEGIYGHVQVDRDLFERYTSANLDLIMTDVIREDLDNFLLDELTQQISTDGFGDMSDVVVALAAEVQQQTLGIIFRIAKVMNIGTQVYLYARDIMGDPPSQTYDIYKYRVSPSAILPERFPFYFIRRSGTTLAPTGVGQITGTVTLDGAPTPGTKVSLLPYDRFVVPQPPVLTDALGGYTFTNLPDGYYVVSACRRYAKCVNSWPTSVKSPTVATVNHNLISLTGTPNLNVASNVVYLSPSGSALLLLYNRGTVQPLTFNISGFPAWLTVGQLTGTINAGGEIAIPISADATAAGYASIDLSSPTTGQSFQVQIQVIGNQGLPYWSKTYGGNSDESGAIIQRTNDGGYIVACSTSSFGAGGSDIAVFKLNADGTKAWGKTLGGPLGEYPVTIQQTNDDGYVLLANTRSFGAGGTDIWILKLSVDGSVVWENAYGTGGEEIANSIRQTSDGGYVAVGRASIGLLASDMWILRLDGNGAIVWEKQYGGVEREDALDIQVLSGGEYIVAGKTWYPAGFLFPGAYAVWLVKLDDTGSVLWQRTYRYGTRDSWAQSIQSTSDGGYVITGHLGLNSTAIWVSKLSADGTILWEKNYAGAREARTIEQTSDGGYVISAVNTFLDSAGDAWVLKLAADGAVMWQKAYGNSGVGERAYVVQQTDDAGYIVTGYANVGGGDVWVLKLLSDGTCPPLGMDTGNTVTDTIANGGSISFSVTDTTATVTASSATIMSPVISVQQQAP